MKIRKKLLLTAFIPSMLFSTIHSTSNQKNQSAFSTKEPLMAQNVETNLLTAEGLPRLTGEVTDQSAVDSFIDLIISKGGEAIAGGLSVYAKTIVLNLLKECGLDLRDATTKTLEKIQQQLGIIEAKVDAIATKQELYHAETVLGPILKTFDDAHAKYIPFVVKSLGDLATMENDPTYTEEEIEKARIAAYDDAIYALTFDGAPFATYVTSLAKDILTPNRAAPTSTIFTYYDKTMGTYDKWTYQYYRNMKNFIAYIDSTLIMLSNLAKFQIYYRAKDASPAIRDAYADMMTTMADTVNEVNVLFKKKLEELAYIATDYNYYQMTKYISTNKYYSTRMATLTYNLEDGDSYDSKQGLLVGYKNDSGTHGRLQVSYAYQPNQDIINAVVKDYKEFAGDYCTSSYTIQDYLASAGFWANDGNAFRNSAGLFNGNLYVDCHGFMHDDVDYSTSYYDSNCNYRRKNAFEVATYHTWYSVIDHTELRSYDKNYYLCFGVPVAGTRNCVRLDGQYQRTYMCDLMFTVAERLYFQYPYMKLYNQVGPIDYHLYW